jgi:predicted ATPase/DNA-binding SARP family transcriptional activator
VEYGILGPLELLDDGRPVALSAPKQRALLLCLLLRANEVVSADALIDAVWGERPPSSAAKVVQVYVSQLRRALGEGAIETRAPGYVMALEPEQLDAARFERLLASGRQAMAAANPALAAALLRRGLDLWRGRPLEDAEDADFAAVEAGRLEELRLACLEERLEADLALGRHAEVLAEIASLVAAHPLRERLRAQLMLALYRCGRQTDALDAYAEGARVLRDELGLEPGAQLRDLQHAILNQAPSLDAPAPPATPIAAIPVPSSALVGRRGELRHLTALVTREDVRIVTVSGAGGSGKTRVALELARVAGPRFANGVAFVELASVRDPALVIGTIAQALGAPETPQEPPAEALARWLAEREVLLVVDNFEHVVGAAPELARLAARAPRLTVLVTSRRVLHVSGEYVFALGPLPQADAVALFAERAAARDAASPDAADDTDAVLAICRRVDCLPLAIELAAARTATLTPPLLLERLADRVTALGPGPRDAPARQQTLADTLAWSTDLLSDEERRALACLSVFGGGSSLVAAETVCAVTLDDVEVLVDLSLVQRTVAAGAVRLTMLETVREHAAGLLGETEEWATVSAAHAAHFAELAGGTELKGAARAQGLALIDVELDNLRTAFDRAVAAGDDGTALRIATALYQYWYTRGHFREGRDRIAGPLGRGAGDARLQALALQALAGLTWLLGDLDGAEALARRGIERGTGAAALEAAMGCHTVLGVVARDRGDLDEAVEHIERSAALAQELGLERDVIIANTNLADLALAAGDLDAARRRFERTLAFNREHGFAAADDSYALLGLGAVARLGGRLDEAVEHLVRALELCERAGFGHNAALALVGLAAVAIERDDHDEAALLLGRATERVAAAGGELTGPDAELYERTSAAALAALGAERFAEMVASGAS